MTFRGDDRAVSTVVGAVLIFGILVLALGTYQAQIVPTQNEQAEYRHSQTVGNQLQELRNSLVSAASTGADRPVSVTLGTRYPTRTFAVNPPPVYGTVRSVPLDDASKVTISNVEATNDETDDYLSGALTFETKGLAYEADYNQIRNAPVSRYEYGTLYDAYDGGDINRTAGLLIRGNDITVVTLNASDSFSESGIQSASIDPEALSAPYQATEVENSGGALTLALPTNASGEMWTEMYADRTNVDNVNVDEDANVATVTFAPGTYDLRMAAVGVGSGLEKPDAKYLTLVENRTDQLVVEARDRYNNPVNETVSTGGPFRDTSIDTGDDGQATFTVRPGTSPTDVTLSILDNSEAAERVEATVSAGSGGTSPATPSNPDPFNVFWDTDATNASAIACYDANTTCVARNDAVDLVAAVDPVESGVPLEFDANDTGVSGASTTSGRTDGSGQATMALDASSLSTAERLRGIAAYVSGVGNGDRTRVIFPSGGGGVYYRYYEGSYGGVGDMPTFDSADQVGTGTVDTFDITPRNRDTNFGFNFTGYIEVPTTGDYTFYTDSDDGSKLFIDGQEVVDNGGQHGDGTDVPGTINGLSAGRHNITVTYFQAGGGLGLDVLWNGPGFAKEEIPRNVLTPRVPAGAGDTGGTENPSAFQFNNFANFQADAASDEFTIGQINVQDADNDDDLDRVEYVIEDSAGNVVATRTDNVANPQQYQEQNYLISDSNAVANGETYTLTVTVYDTDNNYVTRQLTDTTAGGTMSADQTGYVSGSGSAARSGPESRVDLDVENTGSNSVTITGIRVSSSGGSLRTIREGQSGQGGGPGQYEVFIGSSTPGILEMDGLPNVDDNGNRGYQLGARANLNQSATLNGGEQARITLADFRNNGGQTVSAANKQMTITLYFQDGSSTSFTFTPPGY